MQILIPTIRSNTIGLCLQSLASQTLLPDRITILDSGEKPITSDYVVRMVIDILTEKGVEVDYIRKNSRIPIVASRRKLLLKVRDPIYFMFVDDDALLEPDYLEKMRATMKFNLKEDNSPINFAAGLFLLPNNEIGKPDFSTKAMDGPPADVSQYQYAFFRYNFPRTIEIDYGGISGVLIRSASVPQLLESLEGLPDDAPLEDFILSKATGRGMLRTDAVAWHLMSPVQKRDWNYALENILRSNFENEPEKVKNFLKTGLDQ